MTNLNSFTITLVRKDDVLGSRLILFDLDGYVSFSNKSEKQIWCRDVQPFTE